MKHKFIAVSRVDAPRRTVRTEKALELETRGRRIREQVEKLVGELEKQLTELEREWNELRREIAIKDGKCLLYDFRDVVH